jgi:hypothetical protein
MVIQAVCACTLQIYQFRRMNKTLDLKRSMKREDYEN